MQFLSVFDFSPSLTTFLTSAAVIFVLYEIYNLFGPPLWHKMDPLRSLGVPLRHPLMYYVDFFRVFIMQKKGSGEYETDILRLHGPIYGKLDLGEAALVVSEPELIRDVLVKEFPNFVNRRHAMIGNVDLFNNSLLFLRDTKWKNVRSALTPTFSSSKMRQMDALIRQCLEKMVADVGKRIDRDAGANGQCELEAKEYFAGFAMDVIATCFFGVDLDVQRNRDNVFARNALAVFKPPNALQLLAMFILVPIRSFLLRNGYVGIPLSTRAYFRDTIAQMMKIRRAQGANASTLRRDFLHIMLESKERVNSVAALEASGELIEDEPEEEHMTNVKQSAAASMTDLDIAAQCFIFMIAGFDTTSTTIAFLLHHLAINEEVQDRLRSEVQSINDSTENKVSYDLVAQMPYLDACISETLRIYPPLASLERQCAHECTLSNGIVVPKGVIVIVPSWTLQHSEEYWPDAYEFRPERFLPEAKKTHVPYTYMPFGQGPRNCVGMRFALLEIKMLLAEIVRQYRIVPTEKTEIPMKLKSSVGGGLTRPRNGVHIALKKLE